MASMLVISDLVLILVVPFRRGRLLDGLSLDPTESLEHSSVGKSNILKCSKFVCILCVESL